MRLPGPFGRVFYGWWVVLAASAISALGGGAYSYAFTVFFIPLSVDLELSRAMTSFIFAVSQLEGGVYGALIGWFVDRYGPRPLFILGGLLSGAGYILLSRADSFVVFAVVYIGVLSLGANAGVLYLPTPTANAWFVRRKATAMGITSAAYALGGAVLAPLLGLGIHHYGWRTTALVTGIGLAILVPALALVVRRSPESMGLRPDGDPEPPPGRASVARADFTVREALGTTSLWLLTAALTLRFLVQGAVLVHVVPLMVDKGVAEPVAAGMAGLLALVSITSRLGSGWLGDRSPKRYILMVAAGLEIAGLLILLGARETWQLYLFIVVYALGYGGGPLGWAMLGEYYGRACFATLRGITGAVYTWGSLAGPIFAGWIFDRTQSYQMAIVTFILVYLPVLLLYFYCRRPASRARRLERVAPARMPG